MQPRPAGPQRPAPIRVGESPCQHHGDRLVAEGAGAELRNQVGSRHRGEERAVLRPESGRRASHRGLQSVELAAAATGQKEAEVMHDHQRHRQAEARQHVPPGDRLNRLGGAARFDLAVSQGGQLPPELALRGGGGGRGGRRGDRLGHRSPD